MSRTRAIRILFVFLLMISVAVGIAYHLLTQATTTVYRLRVPVSRYAAITADMIEPLQVAQQAADTLGLARDSNALVGKYLAMPMQAGDVIRSADVMAELPCDRPFQSGRCLPAGQHPYALPMPAALDGILAIDDLINVWALDDQTRQARVLLQKRPLLDIRNGNLIIAVTDDELPTLEGWVHASQDQKRRVLVTLTQETNPDYERLAAFSFDPSELTDARSFLPAELAQYLNPYIEPPREPATTPTTSEVAP
jgi:hypothetical protein